MKGPIVMRGIWIGLCLVCAVAATAAPPPAKKAVGGLAVDVVTLKSGRTLRGAILQRHADRSLTMAVSRDWLKTANAELFEQYDAENLKVQREAQEQSRDRLKDLLATPSDEQRFTFFLQSQLEEIERQLAADDPKRAEFLWVDLPASQVAKVAAATPDHQKLAVIAWNEGFINVETQDAATLQRELTKRDIKLDGPAPDISPRLPPRPQDDREWTARRAVLDYVYRQPLEFQGMGDALFRTGQGQKMDMAAVFQKVMQQQVEAISNDLLGNRPFRPEPMKRDSESFAPAIAAAESMGVRGFRVTRLLLETERNRVGVETRFVAQLDNDQWQTVFVITEFADTNQRRPEAEAKIEQSPQVKALFESIRNVGILGDAPLQTAIRTGAATQAALQSADQAFFNFTSRYTQHVDRPKLFLSPP